MFKMSDNSQDSFEADAVHGSETVVEYMVKDEFKLQTRTWRNNLADNKRKAKIRAE